jgi:hypothetical protein
MDATLQPARRMLPFSMNISTWTRSLWTMQPKGRCDV